MIDLHLSAFAPRWRFLYAVRIDAYIPSAQEPCISAFHRFLPQFGHKKDTTEVVSFYGAQPQQQPRTSWYSTDLGAGQ